MGNDAQWAFEEPIPQEVLWYNKPGKSDIWNEKGSVFEVKLSHGKVRFVNAVAGSGLFVFIETDPIEKLEEEGQTFQETWHPLNLAKKTK